MEKTQELTEKAKQKASAVTAQASAVGNSAKGIEQAADKQKEALDKAKAMMPNATTATEEALTAFRSVLFVRMGMSLALMLWHVYMSGRSRVVIICLVLFCGYFRGPAVIQKQFLPCCGWLHSRRYSRVFGCCRFSCTFCFSSPVLFLVLFFSGARLCILHRLRFGQGRPITLVGDVPNERMAQLDPHKISKMPLLLFSPFAPAPSKRSLRVQARKRPRRRRSATRRPRRRQRRGDRRPPVRLRRPQRPRQPCRRARYGALPLRAGGCMLLNPQQDVERFST